MVFLLILVEPVFSLTQALKYGLTNQAINKKKTSVMKIRNAMFTNALHLCLTAMMKNQ